MFFCIILCLISQAWGLTSNVKQDFLSVDPSIASEEEGFDSWVLNYTTYYFDKKIKELDVANWYALNNRNISAEQYDSYHLSQFSVYVPVSSQSAIEGSAKSLYNNPGLFDQFLQWFKNTWSQATGTLWQAPGGCWWYQVTGVLANEKNCIGALSNSAIISGDNNDLISCPSSGYVCYKYHEETRQGAESQIVDGNTWCASPDKSTARSNGENCKNFGVGFRGTLTCGAAGET